MTFTCEFIPLPLDELRRQAAVMKADQWRFVQTCATNTDDGIDLYYSFMKDGELRNYRISGVTPDMKVPSITDLFLAAFVFENEARELFGVNMGPIAIDFDGGMYNPPEAAPMTFISPEQKAAKEKARKVAAAKAAKSQAIDQAEGVAAEGVAATGKRRFVMTPELQARLDAKMPSLSPEKVEKVNAALARLAEEQDVAGHAEGATPNAAIGDTPAPDVKAEELSPQQLEQNAETPIDKALEEKLAQMDPAKAAKVREALDGRKGAVTPGHDTTGTDEPPADFFQDEDLEKLIGMMDEEKAEKVKKALSMKEGE